MSNIAPLAQAWLDAKRAETDAIAKRHAVEAELAAALECPGEGSKTHKLDGFKIIMTQPVTRKVDAKAWDMVKAQVPEGMQPVKVKLEADATGCKWLAKNEPDMWAKIARAFETKPGKIGVKVEVV